MKGILGFDSCLWRFSAGVRAVELETNAEQTHFSNRLVIGLVVESR